MKTLLKNKKAIMQFPLYLLTMVILVVMIAAFFLVSKVTPHTSGIIAQSSSSKDAAVISLQSYLATPVKAKIDNQETTITMADLIRLYCKDARIYSNLEPIFQTQTWTILDKAFSSKEYFSSGVYVEKCGLSYSQNPMSSTSQLLSSSIEMPISIPGVNDVKIVLEIKKQPKNR